MADGFYFRLWFEVWAFRSRLPTFIINEILKWGWLFDDPRAACVVSQQIRFTKRLQVFDLSFGTRHQPHVMFGSVGAIRTGAFECYFIGSGFKTDLSDVKFGDRAVRDLDHQDETWRIRTKAS